MTVFGDWFFESSNGNVFMLDLVAGKLTKIAESRADFISNRDKHENLAEWFMADLALLCYEKGLRFGTGQCLGYKLPPILNGELAPHNIEITDLMVHQSILAQIHKGIKDLPEGTRINNFTIDDERP